MAKTKLDMDEHGFCYEAMFDRKAERSAKEKELSVKITDAQNRLAEINVLKTHIVNYSKRGMCMLPTGSPVTLKSIWRNTKQTSSSTKLRKRLLMNWA